MQVAPAEIEEGCIEYKRNFVNVNESKLNHLTAQMNWRINEGNGICYYYIGVCDNGLLYEHFTQEQLDYSLDILKMMVEGCNSYIDNIIINRIREHIWLNITIKRHYAFITEYRILIDSSSNVNKLFMNKKQDIYFNSIIHNNERYLFFKCNKKIRTNIENIIDFNLVINKNFNDLNNLMNYVENNMNGNMINNNTDIIFNIIKCNYIESIGYILFGYLKQGTIKTGMKLKYKNENIQILSIHNNYIECNEATAPSTISLKILLNNNNNINNNINKLEGNLFKSTNHDRHQLISQGLDREHHRELRRDQQRQLRRERRREYQQYQHH